MDCRTARLLAPFSRPGCEELERADRLALEQHLSDCPDCRLEVDAERSLDALFARAMHRVPVPEGLRERVVVRLSRQRRRFYGRCVVQSLAAAAVLFIACMITYRMFPEELESVVRREEPSPLISPPPREVGPFRSIEHMLQHIRNQGCPAGLPQDVKDNWDFRLLQYAAVEIFDARPTATLAFKNGSASAKLRLFRRELLTVDKFEELRTTGYLILGNTQKDPFIAIVELGDGARLEDFLHPKQTVA